MSGIKKVAVICILTCGDQYLLLQRAKMPNIGKFVPVGGKIDPYESPREAVLRETWEETGIKLDSVDFCGILTETSPIDYNWVSYIYKAEIDFVPAPECDEGLLVWMDESQLETLDTPPTDGLIYQLVKKNQTFILSAEYDKEMTMIKMIDELTGIHVFQL